MNSKNSATSDPHRLLFNLTDKINLKKVINMLLYLIFAYAIHGKILKSHIRTINLKHQVQHEINNLNYLNGHSLYQIFKIILNIC